MEISDSVLDLIGNTPLVRLSRVTQGVVPVPGLDAVKVPAGGVG